MPDNNNDHLNHLPPHNLDAERSILGTILLDPDTIPDIISAIPSPDYFYSETHRVIYQTVIDLFEADKPVDIVTIKEEFRKRRKLKEIGGAVYLTDLVESVPTTKNIKRYIEIVREKKALRDLLQLGEKISSSVYDESVDSGEAIETAEDLFLDIRRKSATDSQKVSLVSSIKTIGKTFSKTIHTGVEPEFPFKFSPLQTKIGGTDRGILTLIGGYTSQAKTTLAIQLADDFADANNKTLICSSEMPELQTIQRIICRRCHIDSEKFLHNRLTGEDKEKIEQELEVLDIPLWMSRISTVNDVHRAIRETKADIVFVDHIHQMTGPGNSEYDKISNIMVGLKNLAMQENISVIAVSQLRRAAKENPRPPRLSDFRGSGRIEENAQIAILLYWPWQIMGNEAKIGKEKAGKHDVLLIVAKQTAGPVGRELVYFAPEHYELTKRYKD